MAHWRCPMGDDYDRWKLESPPYDELEEDEPVLDCSVCKHCVLSSSYGAIKNHVCALVDEDGTGNSNVSLDDTCGDFESREEQTTIRTGRVRQRLRSGTETDGT